MMMRSTRPARLSEVWRSRSPEALPRIRKRAGFGPPVGKHPQHREEVRPALDLVDDHQALERAQGGHRLVETREARRVLEIEVVDRVGGEELPGQRGLAALPRALTARRPGCARAQHCMAAKISSRAIMVE